MKVGVLKKGFTIKANGLSVFIPKNTIVVANGSKLTFKGVNGLSIFKSGNSFYANLWGKIYKLLPFNPTIPYPLTLIN
ncbi:MAG: hypothetical protein ACTSV7_00135 [Candidatus Baldrarchaeia archaeon]